MSTHAIVYEVPYECPLCGIYDWEFEKPILNSCRKTYYRGEKFIEHLLKSHSLTFYDFLEKINFEIPKCECSCGECVSFKISGKIRFNKKIVHHKPWNKGLTKNDDKRIAKLSNDRFGSGNPMYGKEAWNKGTKGIMPSTRGRKSSKKTIEKLKKWRRDNPDFKPNLGNKYSEETREKIRQATIRQIQRGQGQQKTSIENKFEEFLISKDLEYQYNFNENGFLYDFMVQTKYGKVLVETHGDFWHANPKFYDKNNLYDVQKRNIARDKIKKHKIYLNKKYLGLIVIWEDQINRNKFRRSFWKELRKLYKLKELGK